MAQRKYDEKLKQEVIEAVLIGERSAAQLARDYDLPTSAVYSWIRKYKQENDLAVLKLKSETPEQELARLRAENLKLKQERDILKKATAYFASLEK